MVVSMSWLAEKSEGAAPSNNIILPQRQMAFKMLVCKAFRRIVMPLRYDNVDLRLRLPDSR